MLSLLNLIKFIAIDLSMDRVSSANYGLLSQILNKGKYDEDWDKKIY